MKVVLLALSLLVAASAASLSRKMQAQISLHRKSEDQTIVNDFEDREGADTLLNSKVESFACYYLSGPRGRKEKVHKHLVTAINLVDDSTGAKHNVVIESDYQEPGKHLKEKGLLMIHIFQDDGLSNLDQASILGSSAHNKDRRVEDSPSEQAVNPFTGTLADLLKALHYSPSGVSKTANPKTVSIARKFNLQRRDGIVLTKSVMYGIHLAGRLEELGVPKDTVGLPLPTEETASLDDGSGDGKSDGKSDGKVNKLKIEIDEASRAIFGTAVKSFSIYHVRGGEPQDAEDRAKHLVIVLNLQTGGHIVIESKYQEPGHEPEDDGTGARMKLRIFSDNALTFAASSRPGAGVKETTLGYSTTEGTPMTVGALLEALGYVGHTHEPNPMTAPKSMRVWTGQRMPLTKSITFAMKLAQRLEQLGIPFDKTPAE